MALCRLLFNFLVLIGAVCAGGAGALAGPLGVSPELSALLARCAPTVHPETMAAVVSAESRGHQFALADAGPKHLPWSKRKTLVRSFYFGSVGEAAGKANELIAAGHTVSLGPAQINDRNLARLGLSVASVFEPCTNLAAGGQILTEFYKKAEREFGPGAKALRAALSAYNSGSWLRGEKDGYVSRVVQQVGRPLALQSGRASTGRGGQQLVVPALSPWWKTAQSKKAGRTREFAMSAKEFVVTVSD